jgi:hypothetical protein
MATEIGTLVAKFTADTSHFEAGKKRVELGLKSTSAQTQQFTHALNNALRSVSPELSHLGELFGKQAGQINEALSSATAGVGGMIGAISTLGVTLAGSLVAIGGAAAAIYGLALRTAEARDRIGNMADKINFSVRTLSGLRVAAEASGSSLEGLTTALGIFDKHMEEAAQGDERLSKLFKGLKIDATDNEKAFRQVADILVRLGGTSQQTALAMELFGRSGRDVLGIIKAADGDVEKFIKQMEALGIVMTDKGAKAGQEFNKQIITVRAQLTALERQLGEELMPLVLQAATNFSTWLTENRGQIRKTIIEIGNLIKAVVNLAQYIKYVSPIILVVEVVSNFSKLFPSGGNAQAITNQQSRNVFTQDPVTGRRIYSGNAPFDIPGEYAVAGGAGQYSVGAGAPPGKAPKTDAESLADMIRRLLARGGGGKGGGEDQAKIAERMAKLQLDAVIAALNAEQEANKRSLDRRRQDFNQYATLYMEIENRRHNAVIAGLDKERDAAEKIKKSGERTVALQEIQNKQAAENITHEQNRNHILDERATILDQIEKFLRDQDREIGKLTNSTNQWDQAYRDLVDTLRDEGVTLEANTRKRVESNIARAKELELILSVTRARRVADITRERFETKEGRNRPPGIDLGGGSIFGGEPSTTSRPRIATAEEQVMRDRLAKIREQMHQLGDDVTSIFAQSVGDGFNKGIKSGLNTLAQGLLRIVEEVFLRRLAKGLGDLLTTLAGGGGGNFLSKIIIPIAGAAAGAGIGGIGTGSAGGLGSAFAGAFASGGTIPMGQWGTVHDNERVYATPMGAQVVPAMNGKSGPQVVTHNHFTINLPPDSRGSYSSPRSKRQLSESLIAALQAAQT